MDENWKWVPGYEGLYEVSDLGQVKSHPRLVNRGKGTELTKEKMLKATYDGGGYQRVTLVKDGLLKTILLHRLVMLAFVGKSALQVDHKDEDKSNNRLSNLRYSTCRENHTF